MPVGSPFHPRTHALCESLNYREWSGYFAVSAFEATHEHEYNAIRQGAALIDISPLFKYVISGPDATAAIDRVVTRDVTRLEVGQVVYTTWCDERGKIVDDGTLARLDADRYRWTAADPSARWFRQCTHGLRVSIEDVSQTVAALAVQGPRSAALLQTLCDIDVGALRYFRLAAGTLAGVPVEVSRTGYTGDLGYEIWMPAARALEVWDALTRTGAAYGARPVGMLALDIARIEAGLLLTDVDFLSVRKAVTPPQTYSPFEMGLGRLVDLEAGPFVGRSALRAEAARQPVKRIVGLEVSWPEVEAVSARHGLSPQVPAVASRTPVPVYSNGRQVGKATSTTWSPTLKRLIAIATVDGACARPGTALDMEWTVEAVRHRVAAAVAETPFLKLPRKLATPASPPVPGS